MVSTGFDHVVLATHPLAQQVLDNRNIDNNKYFPADKLHFRIEFVPLRIGVARRWVMHSAPKIVHGANYWPNHHPSRIVVVVPRFAPSVNRRDCHLRYRGCAAVSWWRTDRRQFRSRFMGRNSAAAEPTEFCCVCVCV